MRKLLGESDQPVMALILPVINSPVHFINTRMCTDVKHDRILSYRLLRVTVANQHLGIQIMKRRINQLGLYILSTSYNWLTLLWSS